MMACIGKLLRLVKKCSLPSSIFKRFLNSIKILLLQRDIIVRVKHPAVRGKERSIREALKNPDKIRKSKTDNKVYLFYKKQKKYHLCVVVRHLNGDGFIITIYITNKIKEGEQIWPKK
jgi:hypothetical protein